MASSKWKGSIANWLCCGHNQPDQISNAPPAGPDHIWNAPPACPDPPDQISNAPLGGPDPPVFKMEITLEGLDKLLVSIEAQLVRLEPAGSSNISLLGLQWDEYKGYATSFVQKLPADLTRKVAQTSESLFLPLLRQALGGLGKLHWVAVGFSFIAWSLDTIATDAQNYKDCLELLKRTVSLLKKTRKVWQATSDNDNDIVEALQNLVERALQCAIICGSVISDCSLFRILKASTIKDSINNVHTGLDRAVQHISYFMQADEYVERKSPFQRQVTFAPNKEIVGGDEVIKEAMVRLTRDDSQVVAVCLQGMGGIGKSTLGMEILTKFQGMKNPEGKGLYRCCRVELRMGIKEEEFPEIQKEILGKILISGQRKSEFSNTTDGIQLLKKQLSELTEPVFLYLDNVLGETHLTKLLPGAPCFPNGSKILVTTTHEHVCGGLKKLEIRDCELIKVNKLDGKQAKRLLRMQLEQGEQHVEGKSAPIDASMKKLERKVLELCGGLPLALKVVGSHINAHNKQGPRDTKVWESVIDAMSLAEPFNGGEEDSELYSRLRFSIDFLLPNLRKAFLDVAYAAVGGRSWSWSDAERLVSSRHLENLRQRALVENLGSKLALHDVFKIMGSQMVKADKEEIRITGQDAFLDNCRSPPSALEKVVGLTGVTVQAQQLQQMPHLRLLVNVRIEDGEWQATPAKLKNLSVVRDLCSESTSPFDLSACTALKALSWECLGNAPDLEVLGRQGLFQQLDALTIRGWNRLLSADAVTRLQSLKMLGISECESLQSLPAQGMARLTGLRTLDLSACTSLRSLPEEVASLTGLEELDLSQCQKLQSLPEGIIANLTNLKRLELWGCESLQSLPEGVASLTGLEELDLSQCERLQSLPEGIAELTNLKRLLLWGCESLQSLPEGIANLTNLKSLSACGSLQSLPEGVASLTGLEGLDLYNCNRLQSLPEGIGDLTNLKRLNLWGCDLQSLPEGVASLTGLEELDLSQCKRLQSLPEGIIANLTNLKRLRLWGCESLQSLPKGVASLTGLEELRLSQCKRLRSLPQGIIANLTNLKRLQLWGFESLQSLPEGVASLMGLEELGLFQCKRLQSLPEGIGDLTNLKRLNLWGCESLQSLPEGVASLTGLEELDLSQCKRLQSLPEGNIANLTNLKRLRLRGCESLQSLPKGIASLMGLEELGLSQCKRLRSLPQGIIANLTNLKRLQLSGFESLQSLPEGVASLTGLEELSLSQCKRLQSLPEGIGDLTNLKRLNLRGCESLQSLPEVVGSLMGLEELDLSPCKRLQSLPEGIGDLTNLKRLNLWGCESLKSLPEGVASVTGLEELRLSQCKRLRSLPQGIIANLTNLKRLNLWGCESLQSLPEGVASLTGLEELDLSQCKTLQSLPEGIIASLTNLKRLNLWGCESLQLLPEGVASLTGLEELGLSQCKRLRSLPQGIIANLTNLKRLELWGCESLQSLPEGVASLTGLEELCLSQCERLQSVPGGIIADLTNLKTLQLRGCESIQSLPEAVASLMGLEELDLSQCKRLQSLPEGIIADLTNLKRLQLRGCESLQSLPEAVASLTGLEELRLSECKRLQSLPEGIAELTNLKRLYLDGCESFQSLPKSITSLTGLVALSLMGCCGIQALPDGMFGQLTRLQMLGLDACWCPRRTLVRPLKPASSAPSRRGSAILLGAAHMNYMWNSSSNVGGQHPLYLTHLFSLPEEISQLTTLQFLSLQFCCEVEALPACQIGQLTGLEDLELRFRGSSRLPEDIVQLNSLSLRLRLVLKDGDFEALPSGLSRLQDLSISLERRGELIDNY